MGLSVFNQRLSAIFLVVYAVTFSLASCDWIMLLEPMWFSTMWGVYNFAGMIQAALAVVIILGLLLRSHDGPLHGVFTFPILQTITLEIRGGVSHRGR